MIMWMGEVYIAPRLDVVLLVAMAGRNCETKGWARGQLGTQAAVGVLFGLL